MAMGRTIAVMIAEKNRHICSSYRSIIEKESDMNVVAETDDGEKAVLLVPQVKPDVIIIDDELVNLKGFDQPSGNGLDMTAATSLVVSFFSDSRLVIRMLHAGAVGYMLKECAHEELVRAIRNVVSHKTYISPGIAGIAKE